MRKRNAQSGHIAALSETNIAAISLAIIFVCALICVVLTSVDPNEIVIEDCGGGGALVVWRAPGDEGIHWDGLCATETYHAVVTARFQERISFGGGALTVRGGMIVRFPDADLDMSAMHGAYGSEDAFLNEAVFPNVVEDVRAAVADPAWHQPQGGAAKRELKNALDYALRRLSPTGAIWSAPEAKQALARDIQRRLDARPFPYGLRVEIRLGLLTER